MVRVFPFAPALPAVLRSAPAARHRPVARAVQWLLVFGLAGGSLAPAAWAQVAGAGQGRMPFSQAAASLEDGLNQFARQAGLTLSFDPALVQGRQAPALRGSYSAAEGLAVLLQGSGLDAVPAGEGSFTLRRTAAAGSTASLATVTVKADAEREHALSPVKGYYSQRSQAGTKTDTPLIESPQSVSVITRQQIDDQKPRSISEALRYTPGAFTGLVGGADRYDYVALRGFIENSTDNTILDGMKLLSDSGTYSSIQIDPYFIDRVDVFKGPVSVLYGRNAPGGVVAMTSKRPQYETQREVQVTLGNYAQKELGFDLTGAVGDSGQVAYRVTGIGRASDSQYDYSKRERYAIAPQLRVDFTEDTSLLLQANFSHDPHGGFHSGVPASVSINSSYNGRKLPRSFFDGEPSTDGFERTQRMLGYQFEHRFNPQWTFRQNLRALSSDVSVRQTYGYGFSAMANELTRYYSGAQESLSAWGMDNQLQGQFATGPLQHTLLLGVDYQKRKVSGTWDSGTANGLNAFEPVYGNADVVSYASDFTRKLDQTGLYVQDQIAWDRWRFTAGLRHDQVQSSDENFTYQTLSTGDAGKTTARLGAVYLFDSGLAPYLSYSEAFNPNAYIDTQNRLLPATETAQWEAGVRWQPPSSQTMLSAAVFNLEQKNVASRILATTYFEPAGKIRSRGLELEAKAQLHKDFAMLASYTLTDAKYVQSDAARQGKTPYQAPRHMASAWGEYGFAPGAAVGVGVRHVGTSWADEANTLKVPAYTLLDLSLRYDLAALGSAWKGASVRLNVNNLLDKDYVASCASLNYCYFGEARNATVTFNYQF